MEWTPKKYQPRYIYKAERTVVSYGIKTAFCWVEFTNMIMPWTSMPGISLEMALIQYGWHWFCHGSTVHSNFWAVTTVLYSFREKYKWPSTVTEQPRTQVDPGWIWSHSWSRWLFPPLTLSCFCRDIHFCKSLRARSPNKKRSGWLK